jgi:hypothetical protein
MFSLVSGLVTASRSPWSGWLAVLPQRHYQLWLRRQPSGLWRAGSIHQDDIATQELDTADVLDGCVDFMTRVDRWVRDALGVEVSDVVRD